jgi:hypothetical protein
MIIFDSILTTLSRHFVEADGAVAKIGSSLKFNYHKQVLPKLVKYTVRTC